MSRFFFCEFYNISCRTEKAVASIATQVTQFRKDVMEQVQILQAHIVALRGAVSDGLSALEKSQTAALTRVAEDFAALRAKLPDPGDAEALDALASQIEQINTDFTSATAAMRASLDKVDPDPSSGTAPPAAPAEQPSTDPA